MNTAKPQPRDALVDALRRNGARYDVALGEAQLSMLGDYYEHVLRWNARLHLVAPCTPEEFATRHILESLVALPFLSHGAAVVDVGSGAGLPIIPCLIAREDLVATLIESSRKKSVFLREVLRHVGRGERATVLNERFENLEAPAAEVVTCRALDRFTELFGRLVAWSPPLSTLLLFGGASVREEIERASLPFEAVLIHGSHQRFLFVVTRGS